LPVAVDANDPVEGCAIVIGNGPSTVTHAGQIEARGEEEQCATDSVPVDQFAAPGSYRVISAPAAATPGTPVLIVVARATGAH